ncbi:alpha/beta hydrolase [Metasolibacillus fluoroglycofenilyticus]|uniref:alpha/beta hydrolase n=1 Tax=Metasolibacillus fluoroglycofenilyticus TaxID=1239396 RepID=UPI000D3B730A|nr:alpha/beta hydrolase-fold protein [Metasolibacillus fluoroglycofenilyticus]
MYSTYCKYDYPIEVFVPETPAPEGGFPVIFVLDGQRYAQMMFIAMENQMLMSEKTGVQPNIIVSVGHNQDGDRNRRFYDFTAPAEQYHFPTYKGKKIEPVPVGGAADFKQFFIEELIPYICANYNVNRAHFSLYGHSLGGLFSLWCYLTESNLFEKYVAVSPSIWWNNHELLQILHETTEKRLTPVAIYVGGEEGEMVDDAMTFYNNRHSASLLAQFYVALEENHASVVPTTLSKALRFISS